MSNTNLTENEKETGNYVEFTIYRLPKKNHEEMLQMAKKSVDMFRREGVVIDSFQLSNNKSWEGFTNLSKTVSATQDEEVWVDILSYKDQQHRNEFMTKMSNDKECQADYQHFTEIITPGSEIITGEFNRL